MGWDHDIKDRHRRSIVTSVAPGAWSRGGSASRPPLDAAAPKWLAFGMDRAPDPPKEDEQQTRRDLRAALVFGIVAATIELGAILYFFR